MASTQCKTIFASSSTDSRLTTEFPGNDAAEESTRASIKVGCWQISDTTISLLQHHNPRPILRES